jgi:hypothetical protein
MFRRQFTVAACLLFVVAIPFVRAEDPQPTETAKVQVRVIVDGKPIDKGRIFFYSDTNNFVGTHLNDEGKGTVDRIVVGEYVVTVEGDGIPAKYSQLEASALRVKIAAGENEFGFELKSK